MSVVKRALRSSLAQGLTAWAAVQYVRIIRRLGRFTVENQETLDDLVARGQPFIVCYWHSRILMFQYLWRYPTRMHLLISRHPDGRLISRAAAYFGLTTIAGSSSKGGSEALRSMIRVLRAGECVAVTPDGPRGPRMRVSPGVVHTARVAGVPIVPVAFSASRRKILNSWDRFIVPLPFTEFRVRVGQPVTVDKDTDETIVDGICTGLEDRLNDMTREIETGWGLQPVEPDPPIERTEAMQAASRG